MAVTRRSVPPARAALIYGVAHLCGGRLDGIVANAGGGPAETMLSLNFFGAVATVSGLRPLLETSAAPRAVVISSVAALGPFDQGLVDACLRGDETAAVAAAQAWSAAGGSPAHLYGSAKHVLNCWCRKASVAPTRAGAGIPLNVIAPGIVDTPAAAWILSNPAIREEMLRRVPLPAVRPARPAQVAALVAWCVSPENALMTGQVLFADGGLECAALASAHSAVASRS
jgi:NAD(P)-dependent dehydrogenase (short-subunit alcohol dehydrogenase family)